MFKGLRDVVIYWYNPLSVGLLLCLLSRIRATGSSLGPLTSHFDPTTVFGQDNSAKHGCNLLRG